MSEMNSQTHAVRIFVCTYRRAHLLRRALRSLLDQTYGNWVCELHNDDPTDEGPWKVLQEIAPDDPRITYRQHQRNWGAVAVFNHVFAGGPEPYASLLEDDNWWEPGFLQAAVSAMDEHPDAALAWANMRIWNESADGAWIDTGRTIWACGTNAPGIQAFAWPELYQSSAALHSNGAMVFRPARFAPHSLPPATPFEIVEHLRERAAQGTLLLLTAPLANFAVTRATARSRDRAQWLQSKLLVGASYLLNVETSQADLRRLWDTARAARPRDTGLLFFLACALRSPRLLRAATPGDWIRFAAGCLRHPITAWRGLRFRAAHAETWAWLLAHSRRAHPARMTALRKELP